MFPMPIIHPATVLPEGPLKTLAEVTGAGVLGGAGVAIAAPILFASPLLTSLGAPMGTVAATTVSKTVIGGGVVTVAAAGAGLLAGTMLGGGGSQEQKQTAAQELQQRQEQEQRQGDLEATMRDYIATQKLVADAEAKGYAEGASTVTPTVAPVYDIAAGGAVDIGGVTTHTTTSTITENISTVAQGLTQESIGQRLDQLQSAVAAQAQAPAIIQAQEAQQEGGGTNWLLVAAVAAGAFLLWQWRKKK